MKKILTMLFLVSLIAFGSRVFAVENIFSLDDVKQDVHQQQDETTPIEVSVTFDWLDIDLAQRENQIQHYKNLLFDENSSHIYFTKVEFKKEFSKYYKDKEFKLHYMLTNNGVTEDEDAKSCAFYYK